MSPEELEQIRERDGWIDSAVKDRRTLLAEVDRLNAEITALRERTWPARPFADSDAITLYTSRILAGVAHPELDHLLMDGKVGEYEVALDAVIEADRAKGGGS